jgi:hypothetical protein
MQTKMVIRCECGVEIPFVFDSAVLRKTIEAHAETHWLIETDCSKTDAANEGEAELEVARIKSKLMNQAQQMSQKIESPPQ